MPSGSCRDGSVYMSHRDGSATYSPVDGTYIPRKGHDPDSKIPAPTAEEVIEETENVKREHREYLASPVKYWGGVRTTPHGFNIAWLFPRYSFIFSRQFGYSHNSPSCDCADRYSSTYDYWDGYPDHGYGGEYLDYFGDDYEPSRAEYKAYGFDCGDEEEEGDEGDEEDEEGEDDEDDGDNGEEYTDGDRISPSPDENKAIDNQEDDKTTVRITDVAPLSLVEEAQVDVKQKIKEEPCGGPALALPTTLKTEPEVTPSSGFASDPTAFEYAATGSSAGERTSRNSGVGPDIQTEGKRVSDLDSRTQALTSRTTFCRSCEATDPNHTKHTHGI